MGKNKMEDFIKQLKAKNFYFYNAPVYFDISYYHKVIDRIKSKYLSDNTPSIYTWGSVSAPGISDVDIIIVLKDKTKGLKRAILNKKERYIVCHPFFIIDKEILENIRYIYPNLNLELIKGEKINVNQLKKDSEYYVNIFLSIDIAIRHFPRDCLEMLLRKRIDIRSALLRLNSLSLSLELYKNLINKEEQDFEEYMKEVSSLRKKWFSLKDEERKVKLVSLLNKAITISTKFIERLREVIIKKEIIKIESCSKDTVYTGMRHRTFFVDDWQPERSVRSMIRFYKQNGKFYSFLPIEFAALFNEYSKASGILSSYIKKNLEIENIRYKLKGKELIYKRINLLNAQAEIAEQTKHSHFVSFFDFGLKSNYGPINKGLSIARRIKDSKIYRKVTTYKN